MKALLAHGDDAQRRALAQVLQGYDVVEVGDGAAAVDALLEADSPRLAVIDWDLPGLEGPELCRLVRQYHLAGPPYIVLLAPGSDGADVAVGLEAGANDCLRTPVADAELLARVDAGRRFVELPWEQAVRLGGGRELGCRTDPSTGVAGRGAVLARLDDELARAAREDADLSVAVLVVDGLELANDCCGADAGDAVLKDVVKRLRKVLRPGDAVGRLASEELLVVLPGADGAELAGVLGRLRRAVAAKPFTYAGLDLAIGVGVGGATGREETAGRLLEAAAHDMARVEAVVRDDGLGGDAPDLDALLDDRWRVA